MATSPIAAQFSTARLRIRLGTPSTSAPKLGYIEAGAMFTPVGEVNGEVVNGNGRWFRLAGDGYVWSGATKPAGNSAPAPASLAMDVPRRSDNGAIAVLTDAEIRQFFGTFDYSEGKPKGAINLDSKWEKSNIVNIVVPALDGIGHSQLRVHRKAAKPFQNTFEKIADAGLEDLILSCAGTFVPRHKGWDPSRGLSSHSWGIAIDLNVAWNGYGREPAALGAVGSVRELIPIFESEGFAWGGYFQPQKINDGMHFELARRDLP